MDTENAVSVAKRYIEHLRARKYPLRGAYLFGSFTKRTAYEESDIDIAVVLDDFENGVDTQIELMRHRREVDLRIEPHPYRVKDFSLLDPLVGEIVSKGIRIL